MTDYNDSKVSILARKFAAAASQALLPLMFAAAIFVGIVGLASQLKEANTVSAAVAAAASDVATHGV